MSESWGRQLWFGIATKFCLVGLLAQLLAAAGALLQLMLAGEACCWCWVSAAARSMCALQQLLLSPCAICAAAAWLLCAQAAAGAPLALFVAAACNPRCCHTHHDCRYLLLCAPGSQVAQCAEQPPLRQLKPPMQYYSAVQRLCNGTSGGGGDAAATSGAVANASLELELSSEDAAAVAAACRTCSAMSDDPSKVVVQATQANCPDPLGEWCGTCGHSFGAAAE